jgi:hypothetical protein
MLKYHTQQSVIYIIRLAVRLILAGEETSQCKRWNNNIKADFRGLDCEDGRWVKPTQDRVQWWGLVLAVVDFRSLLPRT